MKIIERDYLQKLISLIGTPDIKVITGVRRSGKSKLLEQFQKYIEKNIPNANIIAINFNDEKFEHLLEYHQLHQYIEGFYAAGKKNFVFIDEVQMCENFEKTVISLHTQQKYDLYITGSNAFLLGNDLATLFTGRDYPVEVFPFSFAEFLEYYGRTDTEEAFDDYVMEGGMSGAYNYRTRDERLKYVKNVFEALILRDVEQKYGIRQTDTLQHICEYLMDNIGNLTSGRKIANTLTSAGDKITNKTVNNYIDYLCRAFLSYEVKRYDVTGKRYLDTNSKYYLVDPAFKHATIGTKNINYGRVYENMVAIELLRRGYEVYSGQLYNKEVDFVAMRRDEKLYIQVSDNIADEATMKREVAPLLQIRDAYPKLLLARTRHEAYDYEGVKVVDLAEWMRGV